MALDRAAGLRLDMNGGDITVEANYFTSPAWKGIINNGLYSSLPSATLVGTWTTTSKYGIETTDAAVRDKKAYSNSTSQGTIYVPQGSSLPKPIQNYMADSWDISTLAAVYDGTPATEGHVRIQLQITQTFADDQVATIQAAFSPADQEILDVVSKFKDIAAYTEAHRAEARKDLRKQLLNLVGTAGGAAQTFAPAQGGAGLAVANTAANLVTSAFTDIAAIGSDLKILATPAPQQVAALTILLHYHLTDDEEIVCEWRIPGGIIKYGPKVKFDWKISDPTKRNHLTSKIDAVLHRHLLQMSIPISLTVTSGQAPIKDGR